MTDPRWRAANGRGADGLGAGAAQRRASASSPVAPESSVSGNTGTSANGGGPGPASDVGSGSALPQSRFAPTAPRANGRLVAVVGPSGAGKDTILAGVLAARPDLVLARRVITRPSSAGGEDFEGVTAAEFETRLALGLFAFHWRAHGLCYGIPCSIDVDLAAGRLVLFNGSRSALPGIRAIYPRVEVIVITAPAGVLAERLAARGRERPRDIEARLRRALLPPPPGAREVVNDTTPALGVARFLEALNAPAAAG
ncbi:phosphonate metabolism protein/1,5-bisphosphokinase (PRPP-forming) PhnN [Roseicitreum antarcticum]|uniref:Ribose 1,5-bisphosphate phosphokinase PhnN n=1 Tax=Roseicitreum antarcticum TaxID=564137 RepID=A0A1H2UJ66_9RHOB|nr:phosphonate metabolism protein/1,5-bisphosphokinase (PRPP-forming) PhnN [Roseicitreum antarcticum]SDW56132.1 phosphonate metabolism protein/1,5-bisphosphokinase (PRPP-forming) PhnN [Roseicitreum antarcticum]